MAKSLRILIVEDSEDDALLAIRYLERDGFDVSFERVETAEAMTAALEKQAWDIIIADYNLPTFSAPAALKLLQGTGRDIPFIVISGTVGEETAIEMMIDGANDYVMKSNLQRLAPASKRELHELEIRQQHIKIKEDLEESEQRFKAIFDSATDGIILMDIESNKLYLGNKSACQILGYSLNELKNLKIADIHPEDKLPHVTEQIERQVRREITITKDIPLKRKDGSVFYTDINSSPIVLSGRTYLMGIYRDITERKEAEDALRYSEERLRLMFESVSDGIKVVDLNGVITDVNSKAVEIHGYGSRDELLGSDSFETIAPYDRERAAIHMKTTLALGSSGPIEYSLLKRNGTEFSGELSASLLKNSFGQPTGFIIVIRDITERKKMEEQLIVTDRLASIGELASGIAHELNNPLTGVIGFSELLIERNIPKDIKEDLIVINREAQRTAKIVRNLLTFARKHPTDKQPLDINIIIQNVLEIRAYEQNVNNIKVHTLLASDLPDVTANDSQLQQVFINIVINAEQAMIEAHGGGTFTVTTEQIGNIVRASFSDDGPGIAKEYFDHLFDPFFTTKEVGKGTGLGLSICHGIITENGGRIYAESEPGKGATFFVELPIRQKSKEKE